MIPSRLPPFAPPLPATSASEAGPSNSAADNPVPNIQPPPSVVATPRTRPPGWLAVPQAGDSAASARKRQLPPPAAPSATRLRTDAGPLQAALATATPSPAALQQQAQTTEALATWDQARQPYFYLEQQCGQAQACARHAVNAMVGGPLVSLAHFAQWEANNAQAQHGGVPASVEDIIARMQAQGVYPETVKGTLQGLGIPTHSYTHRPILNSQGVLSLDPAQARFLDGLDTDQLLLQADRYYMEDMTLSHYVAFRKDASQWVLLDSMHGAPQYNVTPSQYLWRDEDVKQFTAIWPQNWQVGSAPPDDAEDMIRELWDEPVSFVHDATPDLSQSEIDDMIREFPGEPASPVHDATPDLSQSEIDDLIRGLLDEPTSPAHDAMPGLRPQEKRRMSELIYDPDDASNHWRTRAAEFEPLRQERNRETRRDENGSAFLWHLSILCKEAGEGKPVAEDARIGEFEVKTYPEAKEAVRLWRMVYGHNRISLRLAPPEGDSKARKALLKSMQDSAAISVSHRRAGPTGELIYAPTDAYNHWLARAAEFEPLRQERNRKTERNEKGPTFLWHLSILCKEAGEGKPVAEDARIREFEVKTYPEAKEAVRLWRMVYGDNRINLRLAPPEGDSKARTALLKSMRISEALSAGHREERPMGELIYDYVYASNHWRMSAVEFEPLWQEWKRETRRDEKGPTFMRHLSVLCKEAGEGKPVAEDARIREFEVKTYPEAKEAVRLWRMVYDHNRISLRPAPPESDSKARTALLKSMQKFANISAQRWKNRINLRPAPPEGDSEAREALLKSMQDSAALSTSHRREGPTGELIYDSTDAYNHWKARAGEFEPLRQERNRETRRDENGSAFLWHLSILCKEAGEGKPVAEDARIREFEVKTYPEAKEAVRLWRMVYDDNRISLRPAPPEGDSKARTALLKSMQDSAAISARHWREGPTGELIYDCTGAHNHWRACAVEFEPLRQERNRETRRNENGPVFLWHLSVLCKEAGEGKPVAEDARIREFEVKTYPEAKEAVRLWRMVYDHNRISLRPAPPEGDSEAREALLKSMQKFANISAQRRKASRKQS